MNGFAKHGGALREHARLLSANVAMIAIAVSFSSLIIPVEAIAACSTPNGRFVANNSSECSSNATVISPTTNGTVAVEINQTSTARFNADSLRVNAVRNGAFGVRLRNGSTMITAGALDVAFESTSTDGNAAAIISSSSSAITVNGNLNVASTLYGIRAIQGSTFNVLGNTAIESAKDAVSVRHEGTVIALQGETIDIVTNGDGARGLFAEDGGKIIVARDAIALPSDTNSTIVVDNANLTINTSGNNANGIQARADGGDAIVNVRGATVTTSGDNSEGIYAFIPLRNGNAFAVVEDVTIRTSGTDSDGVVAAVSNVRSDGALLPGSSSVEMRSGSIITQGDGSAGLIAQTDLNFFQQTPGNASVIMRDGEIITNGSGTGLWGLNGSHGIFAGAFGSGDAQIIQLAGSVTTNGANAHGLYSLSYSGFASATTGEGSRIIANGGNADGIRVTSFEGDGFRVYAAGEVRGGSGTGAGIATNGATGTINIDENATISAASGVAIRNQGATFTLPFPPITFGDIRDSAVTINSAGTINGDILTVDGADILAFLSTSRTSGNILTEGGADQLAFAAGSQMAGNIDTGAGDDLVVNAGIINGNISTGDGNDRLGFDTASQLTGNIATGAGDDILFSDGTINGDIDSGDGNDQLSFDSASQVTGNINMGAGDDRLLSSGTINGNIDSGTGADLLGFATTSRTRGNISTGEGNDELVFESESQLDGNINLGAGDDSLLSGGTINGDIESGDGADQLAFSSTSRTNGNISTGEGNDQLAFESESQVSGNVDTGAGDDSLISAGTINGNIKMGGGSDRAELLAGSAMNGNIAMDNGIANGSDQLIIQAGANLSGIGLLDGGDDTLADDGAIDTVTFNGGSHAINGAGLLNWERIALANAVTLDLSGDGLATGSGSFNGDPLGLSIGTGSRINVLEPSFTVVGDLQNAGTINLGNGRTGDRFTIAADPNATGPSGQYHGQNGTIILDTVLAGADSPTDRLVLDGGAAFGQSALAINKLGGRGPAPEGNGILVVDAANGATTTQDSFYLSSPIGAGVYDYYLYRGGIDGTGTDNWYLRASDLPRPEVVGHLQVPTLAGETALAHLGTYHQRTGGQNVVGAFNPERKNFWSRSFGNRQDFTNSATSIPAGQGDVNFSGHILGTQAGMDLFEFEPSDNQIGRFGVFAGYSHSSGKVKGDLLTSGISASNLKLDATSIGTYYTHNWASGTYLDLVGLYGWFDATTNSSRHISSDIDGRFGLVSAELGTSYQFANDWALKPQAQLIWQSVNFDDSADSFANIRYENQSNLVGRIGARLEKHDAVNGITYFSSLDLWHRFGNSRGNVYFDDDVFGYDTEKSSVKAAVGASYKFDETFSGFAEVNYEHDIGGSGSNSFGGQLGLRVKF